MFISYRRDDSEHVAGRICDRLVARFGAEFGAENVFLKSQEEIVPHLYLL